MDTSGTAFDDQLAKNVSQAKEGVNDMVLSSLGNANASIDMASAAGARIVEAADVVTPFLTKLAKFNDFMKHIADVLLSSQLSALAKTYRASNRFTHMPRQRGRYCLLFNR